MWIVVANCPIFHHFPIQEQFNSFKCRQISVLGFARGSLGSSYTALELRLPFFGQDDLVSFPNGLKLLPITTHPVSGALIARFIRIGLLLYPFPTLQIACAIHRFALSRAPLPPAFLTEQFPCRTLVPFVSAMNTTARVNADANLVGSDSADPLWKRLSDATAKHSALLVACHSS
jgi:hypothetical protein